MNGVRGLTTTAFLELISELKKEITIIMQNNGIGMFNLEIVITNRYTLAMQLQNLEHDQNQIIASVRMRMM